MFVGMGNPIEVMPISLLQCLLPKSNVATTGFQCKLHVGGWTTKINKAAWPFLKIDMRHGVPRDNGKDPFLKIDM